MAINFFDLGNTTAAHSLEVGATFAVLLAVAVAIDWCVRWCERNHVTPELVRLLHVSAMVIVVSDLVLIAIDVSQAVQARLPYF